MAECEVCGNNYDKTFDVVMNGRRWTFDSFECAIEKVAPRCDHCHAKILGHGVEAGRLYFCSAHCARAEGEMGFVDRRYPLSISGEAPL